MTERHVGKFKLPPGMVDETEKYRGQVFGVIGSEHLLKQMREESALKKAATAEKERRDNLNKK